MIRKKLKMRVLTSVLLFVIFFQGCDDFSRTQKEDVYSSTSWKSGKTTFYSYCSACHIPKIKDEVFKDYYEKIARKTKEEKHVFLKSILIDSNHVFKNIGHESLSEKEVRELRIYVNTPQRNIAVN